MSKRGSLRLKRPIPRQGAMEVELKEKELELIAAVKAKKVELKKEEVELKRQSEDHMIMTADLTAMNEVTRS
jgi:hypothetical protein